MTDYFVFTYFVKGNLKKSHFNYLFYASVLRSLKKVFWNLVRASRVTLATNVTGKHYCYFVLSLKFNMYFYLIFLSCAVGYFGQPDVPEGSCTKCFCNENNDLEAEGSCDPVTGYCDNCFGHTSGEKCEICEDWYYGVATGTRNCMGKLYDWNVTFFICFY